MSKSFLLTFVFTLTFFFVDAQKQLLLENPMPSTSNEEVNYFSGSNIRGLENKIYNYRYSERPTYTKEKGQKYNSKFMNHPEFGVLPYDKPENKNVIEDLSKRNEYERYYIDLDDPTFFYIQKGAQPINYKKNGEWIAISEYLEKKSPTLYTAENQPYPTAIDLNKKYTTVKINNKEIAFNNYVLEATDMNGVTKTYKPNWSDIQVGNSATYINNVFPGIDMRILFRQGSIKSDFILNEETSFKSLRFIDKYQMSNDLYFHEEDKEFGYVSIKSSSDKEIQAKVGKVRIYDNSDNKFDTRLPYIIQNHNLIYDLDSTFLHNQEIVYPLVIDPIFIAIGPVSGGILGSLPAPAVCTDQISLVFPGGSMPWSASASWQVEADFCGENLMVCFLSDAQVKIRSSCGGSSPIENDYIWSCVDCDQTGLWGPTTGFDMDDSKNLVQCYTPSCSDQVMEFYFDLNRTFCSEFPPYDGCDWFYSYCIALNTWSITVQGRTLEIDDQNNVGITPNQTICDGQTATIEAEGSYGVPNYTYSWSSGQNTSTINVTPTTTTTYTVTIVDQCGESVQGSSTVIVLPNPTTPTVVVHPPTCTDNGYAEITNYDPSYTYTFNPAGPTVGGGGVISGLVYGQSYTVAASAGTCVANSASFTIQAMLPSPATPNVAVTLATCTNDGSAIITNYNSSYSYTFNPAGPTIGGGGVINGATFGQSYTVTVSNGVCTAVSTSFSIQQMLPSPPTPTISVEVPTCLLNGTGTITNYNSSYTYTFNPAGPTIGGTGLINGATFGQTYTVTVSNGSCTATSTTFSIQQILPTPATPIVLVSTATCTDDGSATITNYNSSYTYTFNPAGPTIGGGGVINGATFGQSYTVTVSNGVCAATSAEFSIQQILPNVPTPIVSVTPATCLSDGSATITNYNSSYTYTFSPTGPTIGGGGVINGATFGQTYTVTASNGSCTATSTSFVIDEMLPDAPTPIVSVTPATCSANGTATITNYNSGYTYTFNPAGPTIGGGGVINGATYGQTYTITVDDGSCTATSAGFSIQQMLPNVPTPTVSVTPATCSTNGTATITNYNSSYTYTFSPTGPTIGGGGAINGATYGQTYTVTVSNGSCTATSTAFSIQQMLPSPATPIVSVTPPTCLANGTATITNYNSSYTYTFNPTGPTVGGGGVISGATYGQTYTVTVNNGDCTETSIGFSVQQMLPSPATPTVSVTPATCLNDGAATITNYNSSYTYTFSPTGPTVGGGGAINGATFGQTYTVTASNGSCTATSTSFVIDEMLPDAPTPIISVTPATCSANGTATITNYNSGYTYTFSPTGPTVGGGGVISGVTYGQSYTVTVNDGNCTATSNSFSVDQMLPNPATPTVSVTSATCTTDGSATITNYNSSYTYTFSPTGPTVGGGGAINGATFGQTYTVTVNNGSCTATSSGFVIDQMLPGAPTPIISVTPASCSANGTATITNYNSGYTYTFSPTGPTVGGGGVISGVTYGQSYTVTVNDGSCTATSNSFTVDQMLPNPATPTVSVTPATCTTDGSATITNYNSSYTYTFSPTGPTVGGGGAINGATYGQTYTVTVNNGSCTATSNSFIIDQMLPGTTTPIISVTPASCTADGQATITNYNSSYTYTFNPAGPTVGGGGVISGVTYGQSYTVTVNDGNCTATSNSFTVNQMLPSPELTINNLGATCDEDGSTSITDYNSSYTYTFSPSGPTISPSGDVVGATVGVQYTITVTNSQGCSASGTFTNNQQLTSPIEPDVVYVAADCGSEGYTTITNYNSNYTYTFSPSGPTIDANGVITDPNPGTTYTLTVASGQSCFSTVEITNEAAFPVPLPPNVKGDPANCYFAGTSSIANYDSSLTYTFDPTGPTITNQGEIVGAESGVTYTVTVTNSYGCSNSTTFINDGQLPGPEVTIDADNLEVCQGSSTVLTADGADTYEWYNEDGDLLGTGESITVFPDETTEYTVIGTSNNGCEGDTTITIIVIASGSLNAYADDETICEGSSTTIHVDGGGSYTWDNGLGSGSSHTISPTGTTTYTVTGPDGNGCESTGSVTVIVIPQPTITASADNEMLCVGNSTTLHAGGGVSYNWDQGLGTGNSHIVFPTTTTTYTVTGTDGNGCQSTDSVTVTVYGVPPVNAGEDANVCSGDSYTLVATGATTYVWDGLGAGNSIVVNPNEETTYTVTGTDNFGCTGTDEITIYVRDLPSTEVEQEVTACMGLETVLAVLNPSDDYVYTWYYNNAVIGTGSSFLISSAELDDSGIYWVTTTDEYGCEKTNLIMLQVGVCDIIISQAFSPNEDGINDNFFISHVDLYPNTEVWIYNRWGAEVYHSDNYKNDWDGTSENPLGFGGEPLPEGTYYYIVHLGGDAGQVNAGEVFKGFVYLKR